MFAHNGREWAMRQWRLVEVTQQGQHRFDTVAYAQTDPPGGTTVPGAESDL